MSLSRSYNPLLLVLCLVRLILVCGLTLAILPVVLLARIVSRRLPHRAARVWARLVLLCCGIRVEREGSDETWEARSVIISNHLGYLDIPVILVSLQIPFRFIADSGVFKVPVLGTAMRLCGYLPIWRSGHKRIRKTMQRAAGYVRDDLPVVIFPEGGINRSSDRDGYCRVLFGFEMIARETGARVHQVTLCGTAEVQRTFCRLRHRTGCLIHESGLELPLSESRQERDDLAARIDTRSREAMRTIRQQ